MLEVAGYVLRITSNSWVDHVFDMAIYYTNLRRKWQAGQTIIFIHRTESGDSVVGYGVIERACQQDELPEGDRMEPEKWKTALVFRYVLRFEKPLSVKETFLNEPKFRGRYAHGLGVSKEQMDSILDRAELRSP
jgi:tRNA uridine 5-carbamoylmethylation protein Kti12